MTMKHGGVKLSDCELIQKIAQAAKTGEVTFTDSQGHTVRIKIPQTGLERVTGDFGERDISS